MAQPFVHWVVVIPHDASSSVSMSTTPPSVEDGEIKELEEEEVQAAIEESQYRGLSHDVHQRARTKVSHKAKQLGVFMVSEHGKAVKRALRKHIRGDLLDDVSLLFKLDHVFTRLFGKWHMLNSSEGVQSCPDKQRYIAEALVAADPSNLEAKDDKIFQAVNAAMEVFERAKWSRELHASGREVWQETMMNIMTPLMFFHCDVRNSIMEAETEIVGGPDVLFRIEHRIVTELLTRPLRRPPYQNMSIEVNPYSSPSKETQSDDQSAATNGAKAGADNRSPRPPWVRYSTAERIAVLDNFTKPRLNTSPAARTLFHLERTGKHRSCYALKAQWQNLKQAGITKESLELGLSR